MTDKPKFGRPPMYRPEYCQMLIEHMSKGLSFESFAADLHTTRNTLYNWVDNYEDFLNAKEIGIEKCQQFYENLGIKHAVNYKDGPTLNTQNYIFQMKNRFLWREKHADEVTQVHNNVAVQLQELPDDELRKLAAQAMAIDATPKKLPKGKK